MIIYFHIESYQSSCHKTMKERESDASDTLRNAKHPSQTNLGYMARQSPRPVQPRPTGQGLESWLHQTQESPYGGLNEECLKTTAPRPCSFASFSPGLNKIPVVIQCCSREVQTPRSRSYSELVPGKCPLLNMKHG